MMMTADSQVVMPEKILPMNWDADIRQNRKKSLMVTIGLHSLMLLLFLYAGLRAPYPPPPLEGIQINFGFGETGLGDEPVSGVALSESVPEPQTSDQSGGTDKEVATQDFEEAPTINQKKETKSNSVSDKPIQKVNQDALLDPNKFKKTGSQGIAGGTGDQGVPSGDPNSNNYKGDRSTGLGDSGDGIGYDLSGRSWVQKPKISDVSQERGKVVISIKVDRNGKVTSASFQQKGSTTTNQGLIAKAIKASYEARFSPTSSAPENQSGTIVYNYKVN